MNWWKHLYHKKYERQGLLLMLLVILVALLFRYIYLDRVIPEKHSHADRMAQLEFKKQPPTNKQSRWADQNQQEPQKSNKTTFRKPVQRFVFDPNTISADSLTLLGFPSYIGKNLERYRSKGGNIRSKEDFKKIYGVADYYDSVADLISIAESYKKTRPQPSKTTTHTSPTDSVPKKEYPRTQIDYRKVVELNAADSTELLFLTGVGPFYAKTILELRERLGGFVTVDQLTEAYGTPDTIIQTIGREWLSLDTSLIRKIDINEADFKTLIRHPYLNKRQVNAILAYRKVHGRMSQISDLKKIHLISEEDYLRLRPYITAS